MRRLEKEQAIQLRLQGKSYNEIRRLLKIPSKGTLSFWFKNLQLTAYAKRRLANNMFLAYKRGLLQFNLDRSKRIKLDNIKRQKEAAKSIGKLTHRELLLVAIALYWGEGYKSGKHPRLGLTNSDPALIAIFMRFIREILKVSEYKIRTHIHTYPNLDQSVAIKFWSRVTKLPSDNFRIVNQVSRASQGKRPKNSLPFGTLDIRVNSRQLFFTMMGWIDGLTGQAGIK